MSKENKDLLRRIWEEGYNKHDLKLVAAMHDPNHISHRPGGDIVGLDAWGKAQEAMWAAFPDSKVTIEDVLAEGDKVVSRLTFTGTHRGEFMGVAPTGIPTKMTAMIMSRIVDGKIVEGWGEWDLFGLAKQIGAIPD